MKDLKGYLMDKANLHTFAICAYRESAFLEECLKSIMCQKEKTNMIISTSTNNTFIRNLSEKYNIPLFINPGKGDMQDNWNYAYNVADTPYVTVVHQDDYYHPDFSSAVVSEIKKNSNIIMLYTDYYDVRNGIVLENHLIHKLKRFFNAPMKYTFLSNRRFIRKLSLSFGNSICCPSVTYNKSIVGELPFQSKLYMAADWDLYYNLAHKKGMFVYINKPLIYKRIHAESGTNESIQNGKRYNDDLTMFSRIWPLPIAKFILRIYKNYYQINNVGK